MDPAPPEVAVRAGARRVLPAMRVLIGTFAVLTTLAFIALFVLSEQTAHYFAWTIQPPVTAAFLGACYGAGLVIELLSLRERHWARTRISVLTIWLFTALTLATTLLHLDRFHLQPEFAGLGIIAQAAGWFWLGVYVVVPVLLLAALVPQQRVRGVDPPTRNPVPAPLRAALALESAVLLVVGVFLFAAPSTAPTLWPWPLTPLTARAIACWLVAFGVATGITAVAGDLVRERTGAVAYTVLGVLVLVATLRFTGSVSWGHPSSWVYLAMAVAITVTGVLGWWLAVARTGNVARTGDVGA